MAPNNHPNRNWRTRMHAECAGWLGRWDWMCRPGAHVLSEYQLRDLMRQAFCAGYETRKAHETPTVPKK